ncbi:MAG: hypothetical protein Q7S45_00030 [Candidatus Curtissbacteria bacterium]|nr:hypothetical protein [Candidatus Curtissbacteria bacterium]
MAERFSVGDQLMRTGLNKVTIIGEVTAIDKGLLVIEIEFCSDSHGNRTPELEHHQRKIHKDAADLVNLSRSFPPPTEEVICPIDS